MALTEVNSLGIKDLEVKTADIAADAVTGAKIADDQINSEHYVAASIDNEHLADNAVDSAELAAGSVDIAHLATGTDGQIITWNASGVAVAVGPGTDGQVLTSTGSGSPPAFEAVPAGGATINNATANELVTVASTTTQLDAEANLTFDGSTLQVTGDIQGAGNDGTANNLKWDQSDDTLYFRDNVKAQFGTGGDLQLYHDATNSYLVNKTGNLHVYAKHGENGILVKPDANVELYFDNNKKLETTNIGISVTGSITPSSGIYIGGAGGDNHLDDYEEGGFDATCANSVTVHSNMNRCNYTKIGRMVTICGEIHINSDNSNADLKINNLPFTCDSGTDAGSNAAGAVVVYNHNFEENYGIKCMVTEGTTDLNFRELRDDNSYVFAKADTGGYLCFTITYFVE